MLRFPAIFLKKYIFTEAFKGSIYKQPAIVEPMLQNTEISSNGRHKHFKTCHQMSLVVIHGTWPSVASFRLHLAQQIGRSYYLPKSPLITESAGPVPKAPPKTHFYT